MRGIAICAECADYDKKKHRCRRGASQESDPRSPFYDDCPMPEVAPVVHGRWKKRGKNLGECSECGEVVAVRYRYCPDCGAKMDKEENDE